MIGTAVRTLRKHGVRRVLRACWDIFLVHGIWNGIGHIWHSLTVRTTGDGTARRPIPELLKTTACEIPGEWLFPRSVLFIAAMDLAQCKKYRVIQREEMFVACGGAHVMHSEYRDSLRWRALIQVAGVVYAYRIPDGPEWREIVEETRRLGIDIVYDIDDPVFDHNTVVTNPNLSTLSTGIRDQLIRDASQFLSAMSMVTHICVSTPGLARIVRTVLPKAKVYVVPNGIDSESWMHHADLRRIASEENSNGRPKAIRILISSGSLAHDADLDVCREGLRRFMAETPDAILVVCGHAAVAGICNPARIARFPVLPYTEYLRVVATADLTLVPLADCDFNESKSIVRFLDAAICNTPVLASDVGEYRALVSEGICIGVTNSDNWYEALCAAAADSARLRMMAERAFQFATQKRRLLPIWQRLDPVLLNALGLSRHVTQVSREEIHRYEQARNAPVGPQATQL